MDRKTKIFLCALAAAVVLLALLLDAAPKIMVFVVAFIGLMAYVLILYLSIRLFLKFTNPYFRLLAFSYGINLILLVVPSLMSLTGHAALLSLGGIIPASVTFPWAAIVPLILAAYAAITYRESWEEKTGAHPAEKFLTLVPAAKSYGFWFLLVGLPLIFYGLRATFLLHFHGLIRTGFLNDVLTPAATMFITLLVTVLNLSLYRKYRIRFFKYLYVISVATVGYTVLSAVYSAYFLWMMQMARHDMFSAIHIFNFVISPIQWAYNLAVPLFTAFAFLTYGEEKTMPAA